MMSVNPFESPHFCAIAKLYPLEADEELYAFGKEMDRLKDATDQVILESLPQTCTPLTIERWEQVYELSGSGTFEERKQKLVSAYNANFGIAQHHYEALAASMGFTVTIKSPPKLLRAGVSRVGGKAYDEDEQYIWTVISDTVQSEILTLVSAFEKAKIPFTDIRWQLKKMKFYKLEDGKLLTLANGKYLILGDNDE